MKMIRLVIPLLAILTLGIDLAGAQSLRGSVADASGPLAGAGVYWAETNVGVNTDAKGEFSIGRLRGYDKLVATYVGYANDTIEINSAEPHFVLRESGAIDDVIVHSTQRGNSISALGVGKVELISFSGLVKMACCNLAESFENSASVTVGYSDAVSGARQIRMLGLAGIYSQLLDETRPVLRGLGSTYGLSYTPGMWLQGIQVSKGVSSVINGHEAITGQINLEHRKPDDDTPLFLNGYFDQDLRGELNVASAHKLSDRLSTVILAHGSLDDRKRDHNHDGFIDMPASRQINVANRWLYAAASGIQLRAGVKYVQERREGGQIDYYKDNPTGRMLYGSQIDNRNFNAYFKAAAPFGAGVYDSVNEQQLRSNVALIADYNFYSQGSMFGLKEYDGQQNSLYLNLLCNLVLSPAHTIVTGGTFVSDSYNERLTDTFMSELWDPVSGAHLFATNFHLLDRNEREAGAFAEYNFSLRDRLNIIAGVRADYNNINGWFFTPRAHLRWLITKGLTLRASVGKGYRSANIITDNIGMLATGRAIAIDTSLDRLEESLTAGGSLTWQFRLGRDESASLSFDLFHTRFSNQVIADQEYDSGIFAVYNAAGKPETTTWQGDFNWSPFTGFDVLATFRYNDSKVALRRADGNTRQVERALIDKYKGLVNLQYATKFRRWVFDFTAQINGRSRLPVQDGVLSDFDYSSNYGMLFAQVTHRIRRVDVYLGCENITDYTQKHPVISAEIPFDSSFNSSVVWGPLMGRKVYVGFRFNL